jgi:hypothetical protein
MWLLTLSSDIVSQLRQMFQADAEDEDSLRSRHEGVMSVTEKMLLWDSKPPDHSAEAINTRDCFQGVEEDIEEGISHPELPTYGRAIIQSRAYEWLIQRLLNESSFHWGDSQPRIMDEIRHAIMRVFPTGRISKDHDPGIHQAEFRISRYQLLKRYLRERERRGTFLDLEALAVLSTTVVLIGSSDDHIQATTVEEYIDQTWGQDKELLTTFRSTVARELYSTHSNSSEYLLTVTH